MKLCDQPPDAFGVSCIRRRPHRADQFGQHVIGFQKTLRSAALIGEFARSLLPGAVDLAQHVNVGDESVVEYDFVEIVLAGHLIDRIDRDAG